MGRSQWHWLFYDAWRKGALYSLEEVKKFECVGPQIAFLPPCLMLYTMLKDQEKNQEGWGVFIWIKDVAWGQWPCCFEALNWRLTLAAAAASPWMTEDKKDKQKKKKTPTELQSPTFQSSFTRRQSFISIITWKYVHRSNYPWARHKTFSFFFWKYPFKSHRMIWPDFLHHDYIHPSNTHKHAHRQSETNHAITIP